MRRRLFAKRYADFVARLRVPGGFLLAAVFVWLARPSATSLVAGLPVSVLGLLLRAWAAGHLDKNRRLTNTGPYAYVRNPLYLGTVLVAAGLAVAAREPLLAVIFALVFLLVYLPVIELEEQHLRDLFPEFEPYAARVPMLLPRLRPVARGSFRWQLYRQNEEYQALLGLLAAVAVLVWKLLR